MCLLCCLLTFWYGAVNLVVVVVLCCVANALVLWCCCCCCCFFLFFFPCSVANSLPGLFIVYIVAVLSINLMLFFHDDMCRAVGGFCILYTVCTCHVISCCCYVYACVYKFCSYLHHDNIVWHHTTSSNQLLQPNNGVHYHHGWSECDWCASCKVCSLF